MAIKLTEAMICLDCDVIYAEGEIASYKLGYNKCPACGSEHGWPISKWIRPIYANACALVRKSKKIERRAS